MLDWCTCIDKKYKYGQVPASAQKLRRAGGFDGIPKIIIVACHVTARRAAGFDVIYTCLLCKIRVSMCGVACKYRSIGILLMLTNSTGARHHAHLPPVRSCRPCWCQWCAPCPTSTRPKPPGHLAPCAALSTALRPEDDWNIQCHGCPPHRPCPGPCGWSGWCECNGSILNMIVGFVGDTVSPWTHIGA